MCHEVIEFAQCEYRTCKNCGWEGNWTQLIDDKSEMIRELLNKLEDVSSLVKRIRDAV